MHLPARVGAALIGIASSILFLATPAAPAWLDDESRVASAAPLYSFGLPGGPTLQIAVAGAGPGDLGYRPWWRTVLVLPIDGRGLSTDPYVSEDEIRAARTAGRVFLFETGVLFQGQVVPAGHR